jgi:hypothetical protein
MKRALILAFLILVAAACDSNYDPPSAYGVRPGYGSNGRAYAAQQSPSIFVFIEVVEEEDVVAPGDGIAAVDIPDDLSEGVLACINNEEHGGDQAFAPYCLCLEEITDGTEEIECPCRHLICVENQPDPEQNLDLLPTCLNFGITGGPCIQ